MRSLTRSYHSCNGKPVSEILNESQYCGRVDAHEVFSTDLAYLKDPPAGYQEPAVDVLGSFNEVLANISSATYTSEHDFQAHLLAVFNSVHDGHFRFAPDLLAKAITFQRPVGLVSISFDGFSEPKVYAYSKSLG